MMTTAPRFRRFVDEPTMSDNTLLLKVEDLIAITFGSLDTNIVNLKMLQSILLILARQMRILEQDVEIRFAEEDDMLAELKKRYGADSSGESSDGYAGKGKKKVMKGTKGGKKGKGVDAPGKKGETGEKGVKGKKMKEDTDESTSMRSRKISTTSSVGSAVRDSRTHVGSIEVVTASQFHLLDSMVKVLLKRTGGVPLPTLPSNEDLLAELAKGTASLTDTMEAMQVNARVKAAEQGLTMMAGLLTQLAASGALPPEVADIIAQMQTDLQLLAMGQQPDAKKSVAIDTPSALEIEKELSGTVSLASAMSKIASGLSLSGNVTHAEMIDAMQVLEQELMKNIDILTAKAEATADHAHHVVKNVSEQMDVAMKMDSRISTLFTITENYAEQLAGFDAGLATQLQGFRDHMTQLRNELAVGILQLESANNNTESAAMMDLKGGYENLLLTLEQNMNNHSALATFQKELSEDLRALVESVELLREQKADRDEVADGLRDKANISRLKGLLRNSDFEITRIDLENRLNLSYDKFTRQEEVWLIALKELHEIASNKASIMQLASLKDFATKSLNEHLDMIRKLEFLLGEPKTAMMTRELSRYAQCGPCKTPALMDQYDKRSGAPPRLPALRHHQQVEEPCAPPVRGPTAEDYKKHVCKRWVGGSHTLLSEHVVRSHYPPRVAAAVPTRKYTGHGFDGRLYLMEEELVPCIECNRVSPDTMEALTLAEDGGGDFVLA